MVLQMLLGSDGPFGASRGSSNGGGMAEGGTHAGVARSLFPGSGKGECAPCSTARNAPGQGRAGARQPRLTIIAAGLPVQPAWPAGGNTPCSMPRLACCLQAKAALGQTAPRPPRASWQGGGCTSRRPCCARGRRSGWLWPTRWPPSSGRGRLPGALTQRSRRQKAVLAQRLQARGGAACGVARCRWEYHVLIVGGAWWQVRGGGCCVTDSCWWSHRSPACHGAAS